MRRILFGLMVALAVCACEGARGEGTPTAAEAARLQSRLEQMAHGYVTEAEWTAWENETLALRRIASDAGDAQTVLESDLMLARGWGELRRCYAEAITVMRRARAETRTAQVTGRQRLYLAEAEMLARVGDTEGISALMDEFRSSPDFDGRPYKWSGGAGPESPLSVTRPRAQGSASITMTTLERYRNEAQFAPGAVIPSFNLMSVKGHRWTSDALRGRVVLLDFWTEQSTASAAMRASLDRLSRRYGDDLQIVGICLNRSEAELKKGVTGRAKPGEQVPGEAATDLMRTLAIFGDSQVIVVDRDGRIAARVRDGVSLEREARRLFPAP